MVWVRRDLKDHPDSQGIFHHPRVLQALAWDIPEDEAAPASLGNNLYTAYNLYTAMIYQYSFL